jgi:hypothetical protein
MRPFHVNVYLKKLKKETACEIEVVDNYLVVNLTVDPEQFDMHSAEEQKGLLAHELWHVFQHELHRPVKAMMKMLPKNDKAKEAITAYDDEYERTADHAAAIIMGILPTWKGI